MMWTIHAIDRNTCQTVVEYYASGFASYEEGRAFADRQEMAARRCGWTWVVVPLAV
jgi:hypothetical protein